MAYKTDRSYTNLVYSSANLEEGTYYLYIVKSGCNWNGGGWSWICGISSVNYIFYKKK